MMLLLEVIFEFGVGGDRTLMSSAVPRRRGTSGVSSIAINGLSRSCDIDESSESVSERSVTLAGIECAALISKTSIRPGVMTTLHSSGWRLSHVPLSDQEKIDAMDFVALLGCAGTVL